MYQFPSLPFAQGLPLPGFYGWCVTVFASVSMHLLSSGSFPSLLDHSSGIVVMQEDVTIRAVTYPLLFDGVLDFARSSSRLGPPFPVHSHSPGVPLHLEGCSDHPFYLFGFRAFLVLSFICVSARSSGTWDFFGLPGFLGSQMSTSTWYAARPAME